MAWYKGNMWTKCIILLIAFEALVLADQPSDEKSHCTADSCDSEGGVKYESGKVEGESGVHLAYSCAAPEFVPEEEAPVIFLHGLGDSSLTWNGFYQNIPLLTHRKACIYDARNHGDSGWNDTLNIDVLAEDLGSLLGKLKIERAALVGHSLGGLTAMKFALTNPSKVDGLLVEDISPKEIPESAMTFVTFFFNLLHKSVSVIPKEADERTAKETIHRYIKEAIDQPLPEKGFESIRIQKRDGLWQFKANMEIIKKVLPNPETFDVRPQGHYNGKALFLYGELSPFEVGQHEGYIRKYFPKAEFFSVEGAGHAIHPGHREFQTQLLKFLE